MRKEQAPSTWLEIELGKRPMLVKDVQADAIVIGSGITGVIAAYLLAKEGKKAVVIEKESMSESTTAYTTAFITQEIDTPLSKLKKMFGMETTKLIWESGGFAIDTIEGIVNEEGIECEFMRCDEFLYAATERQFSGIKKDADVAYGIQAAVCLVPKEKSTLLFNHFGYLAIADQAKFHPLKFIRALRDSAEELGAEFYEQTEALAIDGEHPLRVRTKNGSIATAPYVFVATYDPFNRPKELFARKGPYHSYIIELSVPSGSLPEALYLDDSNPYYYFRVDKKERKDRILLGGCDHREELKLDEEKQYERLQSYFKKHLPDIPYSIIRQWHSDILEPIDGIPFIGTFRDDQNGAMAATGFSGNGMTYSVIAAAIFTDHVLGRKNPYSGLYAARRKLPLYRLWQKGIDYTGELFGGAVRGVLNRTKKSPKKSKKN